jgi:D-glycero-D-manno-heptose 1,7-bisphosphate phosphatase
MTKTITREEAILIKEALKKANSNIRIGFTSGAFDLLHLGHIVRLQEAKENCDILIVGVNSDFSVQSYKNSNRPIIPESQRITCLAALEMVDYCFLFTEIDNYKNLKQLQPDFFFKGPDYIEEQLQQHPEVKDFSGEIKILDKIDCNVHTSNIIEDVINKELLIECSHHHIYDGIVFLDRDGVINKEVNYLHDPEDFEFTEGAIEAIKSFNKKNYAVIIVTNQAGIGYGFLTKEDFLKINKKMMSLVKKEGARIDKVYYCPDLPRLTSKSFYRKPNPGMLSRAQREINHKKSPKSQFMIGDRPSDIIAAHRNGHRHIITIAVKTGYGKEVDWNKVNPDHVVENLLEASKLICENY